MAIYSLFVNTTIIGIFIMCDISNRLHPSLSGTNLMTKLDNTCALHHAALSFPSPHKKLFLFPRFCIRNEDEPLLSVNFFLFFSKPCSKKRLQYNRTSLIQTPKGESEVSVLERCTYNRGHYDDVTFKTPLTGLSVRYKAQISVS